MKAMHLQKAFHDNVHINDSNIYKVKYRLSGDFFKNEFTTKVLWKWIYFSDCDKYLYIRNVVLLQSFLGLMFGFMERISNDGPELYFYTQMWMFLSLMQLSGEVICMYYLGEIKLMLGYK